MAQDLNTFLVGDNANFIENLYKQYKENPSSVDSSWSSYFQSLSDDERCILDNIYAKNAKDGSIFGVKQVAPSSNLAAIQTLNSESRPAINKDLAIEVYRNYGHTAADLDPLGFSKPFPSTFLSQVTSDSAEIEKAKKIYSNKIGLECSYLDSIEEKEWLISSFEKMYSASNLDVTQKKQLLQHLTEASMFEDFLHSRFPGAKRFSVEGGESVIASMECIIALAAKSKLDEIVFGMAHRGRLNTLTKIMGKSYRSLFYEFAGNVPFPEDFGMPGDVKYHMGASADRTIDSNTIHLSLTPNPSHLEAVNSVVLGRVRAKQDIKKDANRQNTLGVLVHGDAALSGQGTVFESLILSQLKAYKTGGSIHIVINNQIGFTTDVEADRFGRYCTDIAKSINAPVLHVNGDDVEAVALVTEIAYEYRAKFQKDIFIDIVCYRKYGHNEGDEPMFTQPLMYKIIHQKKSVPDLYADSLIANQAIRSDEYQVIRSNFQKLLEDELEASKTYKPDDVLWFKGEWEQFKFSKADVDLPVQTGVEKELLIKLGNGISEAPKDFHLNSKIARQLIARKTIITSGEHLDWATCELLAYATLLSEGVNIRMTGQDVERGTFSHRHAVFTDQDNGSKFTPLNNLGLDSKIEISNSNLSEYGVLAFEYGYSFSDPKSLVLWEAQFGDFANGAQVIIDQFIASGEAKWFKANGVVLLLPHGYEGQGPEHSSARLERYLQLAADYNIQVANCTTPASFFHLLRRQMHRKYRKPLFVMTPKSLLRHKLAVSKLDDMAMGTSFSPVIGDNLITGARKVLFCSGKVYYDLFERRESLALKDVAIVRLEEIYPFPEKQIEEIVKQHLQAKFIWCQEEHENGGAYSFVRNKIEKILKRTEAIDKELLYVGRDESASTATGYMKFHTQQLNKILENAFN